MRSSRMRCGLTTCGGFYNITLMPQNTMLYLIVFWVKTETMLGFYLHLQYYSIGTKCHSNKNWKSGQKLVKNWAQMSLNDARESEWKGVRKHQKHLIWLFITGFIVSKLSFYIMVIWSAPKQYKIPITSMVYVTHHGTRAWTSIDKIFQQLMSIPTWMQP